MDTENVDLEYKILGQIKKYDIEAGQIFPVVQVKVNLENLGFSNDDIWSALESMVAKNWLEPTNGPHWKLLEDGFKAMQ